MIREFIVSLQRQRVSNKFQHVILMFLSLMISFSAVDRLYSTETYLTFKSYHAAIEWIVCCICIQNICASINRTSNSGNKVTSFSFVLFLSVISHAFCFMIWAMFGEDTVDIIGAIQSVNVPFAIYMLLRRNGLQLGVETNIKLCGFGNCNQIPLFVIAASCLLFLSVISQVCIVRCAMWMMFGCDMYNAIRRVTPIAKYQYRPRFNIEDKYKESAAAIYDVITSLYISEMPGSVHFFAHIVAEYAATLYVECEECKQAFGFIECYKDMEWINRTIALFNEKGEIIYYLSCEVAFEMMGNEYYNYEANGFNAILCYECGLKWRCGVCSYQTFVWNHEDALIPGGCYYCKQNICDDEDCSVYVQSRKIGICATCYWDDTICEVEVDDNGIILDVLN